MDYDQYRPATSEKNTSTHISAASPVILALGASLFIGLALDGGGME
jgi:hypothetical protein